MPKQDNLPILDYLIRVGSISFAIVVSMLKAKLICVQDASPRPFISLKLFSGFVPGFCQEEELHP